MTHQPVEPANQGAPKPIVVLLVDDQRFVGAALGRLLTDETGITLHCCCDGANAVAGAIALEPAVILQDLIMPGIDGLALIRSYRSNPATSRIPVIVLSGNDDAGARAAALEAGAVDYLVKLPTKEVLLDSIRGHIGGSRDPKPAANAPQATTQQDAGETTLDLAVIATFRQGPGGPDFTVMLIDQFLQEADRRADALREATSRHDGPAIKAASHALKGCSRIMGANRLGALCARLEHGSQDPAGIAAAPALMASVNAELVRVRRALAAERESLTQPAVDPVEEPATKQHSLTTQS